MCAEDKIPLAAGSSAGLLSALPAIQGRAQARAVAGGGRSLQAPYQASAAAASPAAAGSTMPFLCRAAAAAGDSSYFQGQLLTLRRCATPFPTVRFLGSPPSVFRRFREMSREWRVMGVRAAAGTAGIGRAQETVCV